MDEDTVSTRAAAPAPAPDPDLMATRAPRAPDPDLVATTATAPPATDAPLDATRVSVDQATPRRSKLTDLDRTAVGTLGSTPAQLESVPVRELGRYLVLRQIGAGGMGVVYAAYDPDLDRKLAIKLLRGPAVGDAAARLLREAQAMAKLSHPNVVPVFDVGLHDGQVFIAMDFIDGTDLHAWAASPRPWTEVVELFVQAGAGLAAAHAVGLIHRDFKPDNVLFSTDAATGQLRAQVADFGLARLDDDSPEPSRSLEHGRSSVLGSQLTRHGAVMGTPAYMSPEQHDGVPVDPRTDQYSFCVALYEALYGKRPYTGNTLDELAIHARSGKRDPPPPGSKVPGWLHRLCLRGMQPDRKDRFPRMDVLLAELQAGRHRGRRRLLVLGGLGLAAAVAGGTALAMSGPGLCTNGGERVAAVWNPERSAAAERAFAATGLPYAAGAWTGAAALLDDYGQAWATMYGDTCAATQIRGEQSSELMDLRMTCLQQRMTDMDALLGLFEAADPQIVKRAAEATIALPDLRACADTEALRNGALAPRPAVDPSRVDDLRARLQAARARTSAGKSKDAVPLLLAIVDEAVALGEPGLTAAARLALARAQAASGADEAALASASAAVWQAIADRDDETLWDAVRHTIQVVGYKLARKADAAPWIEHAQALLRRRGQPPALAASLLRDLGMVEIAAGNPGGADAPLAEAVAIYERLYGPEHPRLGASLNALGAARLRAGRYAEAQALLERAVRIAETAGGPQHPDVANALNNLALTLERQNRYDEAITALRRSLAIVQRINPDDPNGGVLRQNIGGMLNLAGRLEEARVELAAALELQERTLGPGHPALGGTLTFTADVLRALDDLPGARTAALRAYEIRKQALGPDHPDLALSLLALAEVDLREDQFAAALGHVDQALALVASTAFDPGDLGLLHFARARALRALGSAEQASLAAEAARVALTTAGLAGQKPLAELTAWSAQRP